MRPELWPEAPIRLNDDVGEMLRQAKDLNARLRAERGGAPLAAHPKGSFPWLLEKYHHSPRYKDLSKNTQELYDYCAKEIIAWSKIASHPHVKNVSRPSLFGFLEKFNDKPTKKKKIYVFLRVLMGFAVDLGEIEANPALAMRVKEPVAQVHIWTDGEIVAAIKSADDLGMRNIGTAILVAADTGQRQGDVLSLQYGRDYLEGRFRFIQNKTKEIMSFNATELLKERLAGAEGLIVPTKDGKRYGRIQFFRDFKTVMDAAGLNHCKFQTLRHTAIVRLARAGCSHSEIAAISGHTDASVASILRRYLPRDTIVADNAISKLELTRGTGPVTH